MLHSLVRRGASMALCALLLLPAMALAAAASSPLGTIRCDGSVFLGSEKARLETAVYSGDQVTTADGRATLSLSRGNRALIDRESTASLLRSAEGVTVGLERGRVAWTADTSASLRVETAGLTMAPAGSFPSLAEVAMKADGSVTLSVHKGSITVQNLRAAPVVVAAGEFITISPRLAQQGQAKSEPIGTGAHGKMTLGEKLRTFRIGNLSHGASTAIVVGTIGAATATAIIVPLTVGEEEASPSTP